MELFVPFLFIVSDIQGFQISNNVTNCGEFANVIVVDLNIELILAQHYQIGKLNGIDAEVVGQLRFHGDFIAIDLQFLNQKIDKLFVHIHFLLLHHKLADSIRVVFYAQLLYNRIR